MRIPQVNLQYLARIGRLGGLSALAVILWSLPANATDPIVPWECSGFVGEAQNRCARTFTELQQEKIANLEKELEIQQRTVQHLQYRVTQQASATANLERKLRRKQSRWYRSSFVDIYPPLGLSLGFVRHRHFGGSLFFGSPYYYGPQFFGHGHRRRHRH